MEMAKQCDEAFLKVKEMITSEQVLTHYDPNLLFRLACDASPVDIGAVLSHVMSDEFLAGYDYTIEYRNTKVHSNADGLSRFSLER